MRRIHSNELKLVISLAWLRTKKKLERKDFVTFIISQGDEKYKVTKKKTNNMINQAHLAI